MAAQPDQRGFMRVMRCDKYNKNGEGKACLIMAEVNLVSNLVSCSITNFNNGLIKFVANDFHQVFGKHTPFDL